MNEQKTEDRLRKMEVAIFGDGNGDAGIKRQVDEIHAWITAFKAGGLLFKILGLAIIFLGSVAYGISQIKTFFR